MRRRIAAVGMAAALAAAGGCASNAPGDLTSSAADVLRPQVEAVRAAAAGPSYSVLVNAVDELKQLVHEQERAGNVSSQRALAIEDAADALLQDARPPASPTPTTTSATPTPTPTASPTSESPTPSESASSTPTATPTGSPAPIVSVSAGPLAVH